MTLADLEKPTSATGYRHVEMARDARRSKPYRARVRSHSVTLGYFATRRQAALKVVDYFNGLSPTVTG